MTCISFILKYRFLVKFLKFELISVTNLNKIDTHFIINLTSSNINEKYDISYLKEILILYNF